MLPRMDEMALSWPPGSAMPELPVEFIERRWPELFPFLSDPTLYTDNLGQFNDGNVAALILAQKRLDDEKRRFVHILKEWDAEHEKRDNEDQRRHRSSLSKVRANISQRHSWDDVMKELERVQDDYNNPKGFGRVRKVVRKVAAKSERIEPFIAFIPNGDYTSVICGGLRFILGACAAANKARDRVMDLIAELPQTIKTVDEYSELYRSDQNLQDATCDLYVKILFAIEGIMAYLTNESSFEWLKPLILQGGYGPVDEKIDDVKKASENLERALQLCEHKKLDSIQHNTEDTRRDIAALKNLFLQFLRVQFHNTAWLVDLQSQNQGRREISNKDVPPKEYISQSELLLSIQPTSSTVEEIGSQRTVTERVLRAGYATGKGKQARAEWLMRDETGAVGEWFKSGRSRAILVNGNSYVERISSLSFFCAMLIRSLKALKRIIVLDHFCGLHTASDGLDNELCGSLGLLRNLTCQLAAQWRFGELSCVDDEQVATVKSEGRDMGPRQLWRLFQTLVEALPPMTPLFIFIDGISYYETDELSRDTKKLAKAIMRLVRDSNVNAVVKVLFTSPYRALDMADILDERPGFLQMKKY